MRIDLLERRLYCLSLAYTGSRPSQWIPHIASKYNTKEKTVWRDWNRRHTWLPQLVQQQSSDQKVAELISRLEFTLEIVYKKAIMSTNEAVQIGAARTVVMLSKELFKIGQDVGLYPSIEKDLLDKLTALEEDMQRE
jgi:hypothetical protein